MFELNDIKYENILDIKHLKFEKGKINVITGPSGGGKSTLLKMLNKMISPTSGSIIYNGRNLDLVPSLDLRREVSMLSQTPIILGETIEDNLKIAFQFQSRTIPTKEEMTKILTDVKLNKKLEDEARSLSGGEKQRLSLARILLLSPEVFLLDEPSSMLDKDTEDFILNFLSKFAENTHKTIIMVTHSPEVAAKYAQTLTHISEGKIKELDNE
ncbi:ABC transporter ATP-binding protein [Mycoplasma sp. ES3157-GEN-MYC]|uniref:ABC transporter ATP-binding protein n=1 Tax=Mycoplasma miroungigenitalium TaxID=754515 RepID=A0A6M4JB45_9MOLU|nr:ABC transporter ATP-binding protein [Mycoplasma miroungigenitalium]MBU4690193.1 ABC transporter ATP-binding protein [Mycoplasma miroungigenitalium]MBU4691464.1 ABC transporter ATP-binding protein [Mycoplasma miroungigenitalium]QJR43299.1 ABC transporter ATP-binding protein [Mycoplasma miroungigenitalium]